VEKRAVIEASLAAGARRVHLIEEPIAAAIGAGLQIEEPVGNMVVDVGGGTTEVAVISLGGIVVAESVRTGGYELDEAIASHIKREHGIAIGQQTAEDIKLSIGSACPQPEEPTAEVRGRDLVSGLPKSVMLTAEEVRGALVVGRLRNRARFDEADLDMATSFANHAALALELSDARDTRQRMVLLEDRERIARDLHDHVIQRLFATGLTIQSVAAGAGSEKDAGRLSAAVGDIDETIRQIRTTIFRLRGSLMPNSSGVRAKVIEIVDETKSMLGFEPNLRFDGPVDSTVPDGVAGELLAVVRESLTNVARHAQATAVDVAITASGDELTLVVTDDGVGLGGSTRRSGLANMRLRAERLNGTMSVADAREPGTDTGRRGTKLQWKVPLP